MSKTTVAAIDLGATSGRVIVGVFSVDGLQLTEVHRFPNSFHRLNGRDYWDPGILYTEVRKGLTEAKKLFPDLVSCGVDTWGCDHVLVNPEGRLAFPMHAYRDTRTEPMVAKIKASGDDRQLYEWTGLPVINYNAGLQLAETLTAFPALQQMASRVLFLPDYINYLLSGESRNEISIVSTTQLLDVHSNGLSREALSYFGVPDGWLAAPCLAGASLGPVREIEGLTSVQTILVPGHDTSCAFEAVPAGSASLIVSSGTWLLLGAILDRPLLGEEARLSAISNERCGNGGYRPLRIMIGLWLLEQILPAFAERPKTEAEWSSLIEAAEERPAPPILLSTEDRARLFNPRRMKDAIDSQLQEKGGQPPTDLPGYVRLICDSLASTMAETSRQFERLSGRAFEEIIIVGGGGKNRLLCQRTADYAGKPVVSYNLEATSVGNMGYQLLALGKIDSLADFHHRIRPGLSPKVYQPK